MNAFGYLSPLYVIVLDKEEHIYKNAIYGYYLDDKVADKEVKWLKEKTGIDAHIEINTIDTRHL